MLKFARPCTTRLNVQDSVPESAGDEAGYMNFFGSGKITVIGSDLILHYLHEHFIRASTLLRVMPRFADSIIQGICVRR